MGVTSTREACWLLRCAGFGASPLEVQRVKRRGYVATLDEWLHQPAAGGSSPLSSRVPLPPPVTLLQLGGVIGWWLGRMAAGGLREKLTLFWHGFFTTSADPVFLSGLLLCQNQLLREGALGGFEDLLQAVSRDPAMLIYLDGFRSQPNHPNENFAREVMELFTTGPGHYSEEDLRQAARAFTGWELSWLKGLRFQENEAHHDAGPKRFRELRGELTGQQILHRLARDPATAAHVCGRLWEFLVGTPLESGELERLSRVFLERHGNVAAVVRALFLGEAFREAARPRRSIKCPVEFYVELNRIFERPWHLSDLDSLRRMGQLPFLPPSVAGWRLGEGWLDTSTLQQRLLWVESLCQAAPQGEASLPLVWRAHQLDLSPEVLELAHGLSEREALTLVLSSPEVQLR